MSITITWHGHSCFSVSADGYSIVLDPYAPDSVPGLPPLSLSATIKTDHSAGKTGSISWRQTVSGSPIWATWGVLWSPARWSF